MIDQNENQAMEMNTAAAVVQIRCEEQKEGMVPNPSSVPQQSVWQPVFAMTG